MHGPSGAKNRIRNQTRRVVIRLREFESFICDAAFALGFMTFRECLANDTLGGHSFFKSRAVVYRCSASPELSAQRMVRFKCIKVKD